MARFVVVAPREMMALVEEERVRIERMEVVAFPVMTTSLGKVYVPAPAKVPGCVVMTPVPLLYAITLAPEREVEAILLLKLVQSVEERHPKVPAVAVLQMSCPAERESPAPKPFRVEPLSERTLVERPCEVVVPETKRMEVDAVPVVVELVKMAPVAPMFDAFTFPAWILVAERLPVKVEVALPVTRSDAAVAVAETERLPVVAVPLLMILVLYRFVVVADPLMYASPMTSKLARVVVFDAPMRTLLVVVVSLNPEPLK